MSVKLTCPVCDAVFSGVQSQAEANICPNCETDLSAYEILANLSMCSPTETEKKSRGVIPIWVPFSIAILFLLLGLGLGLGLASNFVVAKQPQAIKADTNVAGSISISQAKVDKFIEPIVADSYPKIVEPRTKTCGGFNYTVRRGDSLSLIAAYFYGDSSYWSLISKSNPAIEGREDLIEVDELLLIPNLDNTCFDS